MLPLPLSLSIVAVALAASLAGCQPSESSARPNGVPASAATGASPAGQPTDSISVRADRGRIQGSASATVWFVESSDFQCPYCKVWHDSTYPNIVRDYVSAGKLRMAYINYPLNIHPNSKPAAEAAMCASVQGKFWPMHDSLFATQERWASLRDASPVYDSLATSLGLNMSEWRDCVSKHLSMPLIQADAERSQRAGAQSTPTFFVGDQVVEGAKPYSVFRDAIERALAKASGTSPAR